VKLHAERSNEMGWQLGGVGRINCQPLIKTVPIKASSKNCTCIFHEGLSL
jgi:hypothetical protein